MAVQLLLGNVALLHTESTCQSALRLIQLHSYPERFQDGLSNPGLGQLCRKERFLGMG